MQETSVIEQKEQQQQAAGSTAGSGSSVGKWKLRYPLRSSMKLKEGKPPALVADSTSSSSVSSKRKIHQFLFLKSRMKNTRHVFVESSKTTIALKQGNFAVSLAATDCSTGEKKESMDETAMEDVGVSEVV
ncbi:hypothetical protein LINPERHAP2_LOCUS10873 [Linum perenne]